MLYGNLLFGVLQLGSLIKQYRFHGFLFVIETCTSVRWWEKKEKVEPLRRRRSRRLINQFITCSVLQPPWLGW